MEIASRKPVMRVVRIVRVALVVVVWMVVLVFVVAVVGLTLQTLRNLRRQLVGVALNLLTRLIERLADLVGKGRRRGLFFDRICGVARCLFGALDGVNRRGVYTIGDDQQQDQCQRGPKPDSISIVSCGHVSSVFRCHSL